MECSMPGFSVYLQWQVQPGVGKVRLPDAGWCWYDYFLFVQAFPCFLWDKT
jgi:hypothetical protein